MSIYLLLWGFGIMRFLLSACILIMFSFPAAAQNHNQYCDNASSTAAFQACVKRHHAAAQETLNTVYEELAVTLDAENVSVLRDLQNEWLAYRDNECAWESSRVEEEALIKVYEISCQARMTDDRIALLKTALGNSDAEGRSELYGFPRWMNALASDYPDVYWRFGERERIDLNCDGAEEIVMIGAAISRVKTLEVSAEMMEEGVQGRTPQAMDIAVAVTENPPSGRPKTQLFRLPITETLDGPHLCDTKAQIKNISEKIETEDTKGAASCGNKIEINAKTCAPVILEWTGKDYAVRFKNPPVDLETTEEQNNQ